MKNLIFIGTLHAGITPHKELADIIYNIKPDQLLVEIQQKDLDTNNVDSYPDEMVSAYNWAVKNNIQVNGFDSDINMLKCDISNEDEETLFKKDKEIVSKHNWKDFNKEEYLNLLTEIDDIIDLPNSNMREKKMLKNITDLSLNDGNIVVLTGCYHLKFFEKELPQAIFPLRNN